MSDHRLADLNSKLKNLQNEQQKLSTELQQKNRELEIEAALEAVRSRSLVMYETEELVDVVTVVFQKLEELGLEMHSAFINIFRDDTREREIWVASPDKAYSTPFIHFDHPINNDVFEVRKAGHDLLTKTYSKKEKDEYFQHLFRHSSLLHLDQERIDMIRSAPGYTVSFAMAKNTGISINRYNRDSFSDEENDILRRFTRVFEQAYTRYLDILHLKESKQRVEKALRDLKAAQEQLIQQEKLASLGQLTAGIAHEIKNPLNFINNFSELSLELIKEIYEELDKEASSATGENPSGSAEGASRTGQEPSNPGEKPSEPIIAPSGLVREILQDIETNLQKIFEHGSRADSIVTSMLLHSRGGSGKREPVKLNDLIREYVNLTYHGMRASKNPINVDIDIETDPEITEIPLIAEGFSRVIVNLCSNAFDAMRSKVPSTNTLKSKTTDPSGTGDSPFRPRLRVRTRKEEEQIRIDIEDNGPGVPEEIRDKIMQPFFTTKKGTDGTGLGLSITNDIIKAHRGTLQIADSDSGQGAVFRIFLPIENQSPANT